MNVGSKSVADEPHMLRCTHVVVVLLENSYLWNGGGTSDIDGDGDDHRDASVMS